MQIKINDDFGIKTDNYNYVVCNIKENDEGEEKWSSIKVKPYAKTLGQAFQNYLDFRRKDSDEIQSLVDLIDLNKELVQELNEICRDIDDKIEVKIEVEGIEPLKEEQK